MKIFSVKNEKLSFFNRPVYCESSEEALSLIQNILMSDADRALTGLKDDLSLVYLGDIDFATGKIDPCKKPITVSSLSEIFATIPEEKVPQTAKKLQAEIDVLKSTLKKLFDELQQKVGDNIASCE